MSSSAETTAETTANDQTTNHAMSNGDVISKHTKQENEMEASPTALDNELKLQSPVVILEKEREEKDEVVKMKPQKTHTRGSSISSAHVSKC